MEILQVVGLALVATVLLVVIRQHKPELAIQLSIAFGVLVFLYMLGKIGAVLNLFRDLATRADVNLFYLSTLFKIIGVAYVAEFGAQVCRDAGESAMAAKVEFAAKILVMVLAIPIIAAILETVIRLLP